MHYAYFIDEDVAFNTANGRIKGRRMFNSQGLVNGADWISIEGDTD